jgi:hypothetical protein
MGASQFDNTYPGGAVGGQPMQQGVGDTGAASGLAPINHHANGQQQGKGTSRAAGKVEHAVGTLIGSDALKTRGLEKEQ